MIQWLVAVNRLLRPMRQKALDALELLEKKDEAGAKVINGYLRNDLAELRRLWESQEFDLHEMGSLPRHVGFGMAHDYRDMLTSDIPAIEEIANKHAESGDGVLQNVGFEDLLHPLIKEHSLHHYKEGHLREAVLNAVVAVFDLIRSRTKVDKDGAQLVGQVFSLENPQLIFSELESESGQNDQKGFLQILQGAYLGIRNPKAHSLNHDLNQSKAAEYLVFASLLARRVAEAKAPKGKDSKKVTREPTAKK